MPLIEKSKTAVATKAYKRPLSEYKDKDGKPLPKSLKYTYRWFEYDTIEALREAKDELSDKEQLAARNTERKTTARQAANTAALEAAGITKPNAQTDSQIRLKSVYAGIFAKLVSNGMNKGDAHVQARERAAELLDEPWTDDNDEFDDDDE
jgi:hypothetical protein